MKKLREPFRDFYSYLILNRERGSVPKLRLKLEEEVHPSLGAVAKKLELMFLYFDRAIEELFKMHGADLQLQEIDVARLEFLNFRYSHLTNFFSLSNVSGFVALPFPVY